MIKTTIIGHLGKDAIVNNVNQKTVINFTVAHTEKWLDSQGQQQSKTLWVDCSYWSDKTNVAQYLLKGTQVYLEGVPDVRTYQGQDGKQGVSLTLRVSSVQLLGSPQGQPQNGYAPQPQPQAQQHPSFAPQGNGYSQPQTGTLQNNGYGQPAQGQPQYQPATPQQPAQRPMQAPPIYDPNNSELPF